MSKAGFEDTGFVYVPDSCSQGTECQVHVALHGCSQSQTYLQRQFVENTGYLEWAGTNDIIVMFPQTKPVPTLNPTGCWDFFGFSGEGTDYLTKEGVQTSTIKKMIERLQSKDQLIIQ